MNSTLRWIGIGIGALFGVTIVMLVRSARGASSDGGTVVPGMPMSESEALTPEWTEEDFRRLAEIARTYKMNPADLLLVMASESGLKPQAVNRNAEGYPVAVGLNQLTSVANGVVGITEGQRVEVPTWTVAEQLPLVDRFLAGNPWTKTGKPYDHAGILYGMNFAPARMISRGTSLDTILYERDVDGSAYDANKGLDVAGKGSITIGDMVEHLRIVVGQPTYLAGLQRLRDATGESSLSPNLPTS